MLFPCFFHQSDLQTELDCFAKKLNLCGDFEQYVDKSAYSHARKKFDETVYVDLNTKFLNDVNSHDLLEKRFHGMRVLAIDGSTFDLPNVKALKKEYGIQKGRCGDSSPRAQGSTFYDCLNQVTYDASLSPIRTSELPLAEEHINNFIFDPKDVVTLDRGYHDSFLRFLILQKEAHFCARLKGDEKIVKDFLASDDTDIIVTVKPSKNFRKKCREREIEPKSYEMRLVKVELDDGEIEVLGTSLIDEPWTIPVLKTLYFLRWDIEENYKVIKTRIGIEKFIGQSSLAIQQEFHAQIFMLNVTSVIRNVAEPLVQEKTQNLKCEYKINFKAALSKIRQNGAKMFFGELKDILTQVIQGFTLCRSLVRKGRSFKRVFKRSNKDHYHQNYSGL